MDSQYIIEGTDFDFETREPGIPSGSGFCLNKKGKEKLKEFHQLLKNEFRHFREEYKDDGFYIQFEGYWVADNKVCISIAYGAGIETSNRVSECFYALLSAPNHMEIMKDLNVKISAFIDQKVRPAEKAYFQRLGEYFENSPYTHSKIDIVGANGVVIAKDLHVIEDGDLVCDVDCAPLVPPGCCVFSHYLETALGWGHLGDYQGDRVYFNLSDLACKFKRGHEHGCCGPTGDSWNIFDMQSVPLAKEFGDCWAPHSISIEPGHFKVTNIRPSQHYLFVEQIYYSDYWHVLAMAAASDRDTAIERLRAVSKDRLSLEKYDEDDFNLKELPRRIVRFDREGKDWFWLNRKRE